jgi:hypothetical protein
VGESLLITFTKAFRRWTGRTPADFVRTNSQ